MKLGKTRRAFGAELNIAPLIDVVFLLIIFFMTVSQMTKMEVEEVTLPEAKEGTPPKELATGRLIINLRKDGQVVVDGRTRSIDSLRGLLARELKDRERADELSVLVRGDREAPWQRAAQILRACTANGIDHVRMAVIEPQAAEP